MPSQVMKRAEAESRTKEANSWEAWMTVCMLHALAFIYAPAAGVDIQTLFKGIGLGP